MKRRNVFIGDMPLRVNDDRVGGRFVELEGERFYRISNYDLMPDFFMSIVSPSDQWMFISSNGSLTAGRRNSEGALFPYYPEDKIHDYKDITGSRTMIMVRQDSKLKLWEPFAGKGAGIYPVKRNLYKNLPGNKLIFEEINEELSLTFRIGWYNSDRFGFVRRSGLTNHSAHTVEVDLLDGIQNILPSSVNSGLQSTSSNLLDAYKRQELIPEVRLGIYRLSSIPADTAEPSEALKINSVWSEGFENATILLSSRQLDRFRSGYEVEQELDIKATRGAYFLNARFEIEPGEIREWNMVAEVNQDAADLAGLIKLLGTERGIRKLLDHQIDQTGEDLLRIVASSDAFQSTNDELSTARHLTNVLFNVMRGGLFTENYTVPRDDFLSFVEHSNRGSLQQATGMLEATGDRLNYIGLLEKARAQQSAGLTRLCYEYLALTFSRRHGDPSRPWNRFSIENRKEDGSRKLDYQGNWRDIFQNWEALSLSFPEVVESMICKFVNASTPDGYNPYRITRNGIDWEVPDPSDPWSNIGYWGDHQIIYLLRFLEISVQHHPGRLHGFLTQEMFSYANVPYRVRPYGEILADPRQTIAFDAALNDEITRRVGATGSDGKLLWNSGGQVIHVNLAEKLLVTILSKLSNFIPGAGIWMNTQRPEWNDANNALVGYGVSMVTTYYLRAFLVFCRDLLSNPELESVTLSGEVADFLTRISLIINDQLSRGEAVLTPRGRKVCMDELGQAGSDYRGQIYKEGFSGRKVRTGIPLILEFLDTSLKLVDMTIESNRRSDHLFHSYNLIGLEGDGVALRRLYEMLEGQVAVLGAGCLNAEEAVVLLDALKKSSLFREDQLSYILYPERNLPAFMEKNRIPSDKVARSPLLKALVSRSNKEVVLQDENGDFHFNGNFRNAGLLKKALEALPEEFTGLVQQEAGTILDLYEEVFDHQSFTGRSGTFYGYEGLGSIYWHMVSKLLLAVGETFYRAHAQGNPGVILERLAGHYYEVREGIGLNKPPEVYGAFPTDPYSHTPRTRGAQQPGMTGQVKEDIIARWGELGILVKDGCITFTPLLLRDREFLKEPGKFTYIDVAGQYQTHSLDKDALAFTYCQVPFIYHRSSEHKIQLSYTDGTEVKIDGNSIDCDHSAVIFRREGKISLVRVWLKPGL